jgi:hypothetical protein
MLLDDVDGKGLWKLNQVMGSCICANRLGGRT